MGRGRQLFLLLWLTAGVVTMMGTTTEAKEDQVPLAKNLTNKLLQVIPYNDNNDNVNKLVIEGNLITLNETDQSALASYPTLEELYLGGNQITTVQAKYFSGLQHLRVLSLPRNNISRLDPEAFSGLVFLKELDLSQNELTNLPAQLITGLTNLQILNLQENPWNCSCPLQNTITSMRSANITFGGPQIICTSPKEQGGSNLLESAALCSTSPPTEQQKPTTSICSQQPQRSTIVLKTTLSSRQNNSKSTDRTPVLGNTWKFTACVAALALTTSMLIVSAVKGPSWYKRFHNYRHRRLYHEDSWDDEDFTSTAFQQTEGHLTHNTVTFEAQRGQMEEEEEDGYFEDPYIKREEEQAGEEIQSGP